MQVNCLPIKQVQSAVKIDILNHKIRLQPTRILHTKASFTGQHTFQKPAWRDGWQFLPFTNNVQKNSPLAWGLLLCKSHFTDLLQHGKSLLLWDDIQASHSALAWRKQILWESCQWGWMGKGHRMLMFSLLMACRGLWEAAAEPSILLSLEPGALWAWEASSRLYPAHGLQLLLLLHVAACTSGIWERNIPTIIKTSGGLHILLWSLPFFFFLPFSSCIYPILGTKNPCSASDWAYNWHSSSQLNTPDVLPVPKGSHCVRGFLLNRTKQNSKAADYCAAEGRQWGNKTRAGEAFVFWRGMAALTQSLLKCCEVSLTQSSPAARQKSSAFETFSFHL